MLPPKGCPATLLAQQTPLEPPVVAAGKLSFARQDLSQAFRVFSPRLGRKRLFDDEAALQDELQSGEMMLFRE